ncbi:MAG TPA: hypothetical protein VFQ90_07125 [Stellaceae bacterium]|nr:hypothetical protein [Stellaceae bacterium]
MANTKLRRALAVRDAVLPWLREHGTLEAVGQSDGTAGPALHATIGGFDIWYQRPLGRSRALSADSSGLIYGLKIAGCMILVWTDDGRTDFSFRASKWDAALLRALDEEGVAV